MEAGRTGPTHPHPRHPRALLPFLADNYGHGRATLNKLHTLVDYYAACLNEQNSRAADASATTLPPPPLVAVASDDDDTALSLGATLATLRCVAP